MHHIGRSVGLDCDYSDIHICENLVFGAGNLHNVLIPLEC